MGRDTAWGETRSISSLAEEDPAGIDRDLEKKAAAAARFVRIGL
jgi:hypothetical protein